MRLVIQIGMALGSFGLLLLSYGNKISSYLGIFALPEDVRKALIAMAAIPTLLAWAILFIGLAALGFLIYDTKPAIFAGLRSRTRNSPVEPSHVIVLGLVIAVVGYAWQQFSEPKRDPNAMVWSAAPPIPMEGTPLAWEKKIQSGLQKQTDGRVQIRTIALHGKNIGTEEVQLADAYIISAITGKRLNLTIFGRNPDGSGSMTAPKDTYPIPPNAQMQVSTDELNGVQGLQEAEFSKEWGVFYLTLEYGGEKHRITYDRTITQAAFDQMRPEPTEPHVTRRQ